MPALNDLLSTVLERGARLIDWRGGGKATPEALAARCAELLSSKGEATGVALAAGILEGYGRLERDGRRAFFEAICMDYDPDPAALTAAAQRYGAERSSASLAALNKAAEPRRQELFRRLNLAPGGTRRLVRMREDLLQFLPAEPEFARIDADFRHLLGSWFNRGFLVMERIDWHTPAAILEKIIAYEAVHQINNWDELRLRVDPDDRRCFAFFHPSMPDEPLVFVEVALTRETPGSIQAVLESDRARVDPRTATTAVFYSISTCQEGLRGVSFGAFLIKQVAEDLARELPKLETFVTLSPVPGFARWLEAEAKADPDLPEARALSRVQAEGWAADAKRSEAVKAALLPLAARYFLDARRKDGQPPDPVARFHLGNGAELMDIHWLGDSSPKGMAQSYGIMVNYLYDLDRIEENHEAYAAEGRVIASRKLRSLAATARKGNAA
ncbi:MAG TPA: malonyl-CoA decarboxylase [Thermohalobaculum sp.]|nr:malonyl-CoA decarboxylase [Thermohalobaculum sp.]